MNIFVKTFVVCLITALSFLFYKYFGEDSHSKELEQVNNSVYTIHKDKYQSTDTQNQTTEENNLNKEAQQEDKEIKRLHTCYFYNTQGKLTPIVREVNGSDPIKSAILILLKGPLISESKRGIYSEIPNNVDLINVDVSDKKVIVNLTSNFGNGGGFDSVEHRIKQLSATVKNAAPGKAVYLYINGKEVEYLGGDGVYIKQPLD